MVKDDEYRQYLDRRPTRRSKDNCLIRCGKKVFTRLYPAKKKHAWTKQGVQLRNCILVAGLAHCMFFVVSLAMIGFRTMMFNLFLACWAYSCFLTMNELSILLYFLFLLMSTIYGLQYSLSRQTQSYEVLGLILNLSLYCFNIYFIGKAYIQFRRYGGIKGLNPEIEKQHSENPQDLEKDKKEKK